MPKTVKHKKRLSTTYVFVRFLPILALLLALPITLWAVSNSKQIVEQFAGANEQNIQATKTAYMVPIMVITFLPDSNSDGVIDASANVPGNPTITSLKQKLADLNKQGADLMTRGTMYRGYKDPTAVPSLRFVLSTKYNYEELVSPPLGKPVGSEKQPDYNSILNKYRICEAVEKDGIKEVWMWTPDNSQIWPQESNLSSKLAGDVSNSTRYQDDLPLCNKSYTVYNFNISKGVENMLHNRGHQIEHLLNEWPSRRDTPSDKWKDLLFWGKFVGSDKDHKIYRPGCGWFHTVPNALPNDTRNFWIYQGLQYIYNDVVRDTNWRPNGFIEPRTSDCEDWRPDGRGQKKEISCKVWTSYYYPESVSSCRNPNINPDINTEISYYLWWMQNIPGYGNTLYDINGEKLRNWWDLMGDLDKVYISGKFHYLAKTAYDPPPDTTKPTVVIISPSRDAKVKGNMDIGGGASDNSGISTIKILIDGNPIKTCTNQGICTISGFNTKNLTDGSHVVKFEAEDKSENRNRGEASVTIFVENIVVPSDTKTPDVAISDPKSGATLTGKTKIAAGAFDNTRVLSITLYLDSDKLHTCQNVSLCQYEIDTTQYGGNHEATSHTITAEAVDPSGNKGTAKVNVIISNVKTPPDTIGPDIAIVSPANGQVVRDTVNITTGASDSSGIRWTNILIDNRNIYSCTITSICQTSYNTKNLSNGNHTITVESYDVGNNRGVKSIIVTVDNLSVVEAGAPTVTILTPADNSTVNGSSVSVSTEASDNGSVSQIKVYIDAVQKKRCTNSRTCSYNLNTTNLVNGKHEIKVEAIDNENKVGYKVIGVSIQN